MRSKTFTYDTGLAWAGGRAGQLTAGGKPTLRVASPPEFKGETGVWTPEDPFVAALDVCTMTTFLAFAEKRELPVAGYTSRATGTVEFADGGLRFTRVVLAPRIRVADASAVERARAVLEDAHRACLVARSARTEIAVEPAFEVSGES